MQGEAGESTIQISTRIQAHDRDIAKLQGRVGLLRTLLKAGGNGDAAATETHRQGRVLASQMAAKNAELYVIKAHARDLEGSSQASSVQARAGYGDVAVNKLVARLRADLQSLRDRADTLQALYDALSFTPNSAAGKQMMAKCATLLEENQQLGQSLSEARLSELEAAAKVQQKYITELLNTQNDLQVLVQSLDEEIEAMQSHVFGMNHRIKLLNEERDGYLAEIHKLRETHKDVLSIGEKEMGTKNGESTEVSKTLETLTAEAKQKALEKEKKVLEVQKRMNNQHQANLLKPKTGPIKKRKVDAQRQNKLKQGVKATTKLAVAGAKTNSGTLVNPTSTLSVLVNTSEQAPMDTSTGVNAGNLETENEVAGNVVGDVVEPQAAIEVSIEKQGDVN
eukprot:comp18386_c0_seq1/m.19564 comp18386_c0_seq1/g.19564  ORF comp18386_c0_seq1/g.19564 comp18386_c0_seq1/m.19564 type:complete len:395 (-) comp18386_c0_seq1:87-1271(-)